jgi:hypothetical protein
MEDYRKLHKRIRYFFRVKRVAVKRKRNKKVSQNYLKYKSQALLLVKERIEYFNTFYNYKYGRIVIRNQKTRWGSCSRKGNLNFNYKIALLTPNQADYIIVHELCHLKEFNHSQRFWDLVAQAVPDYKEVRHSLRDNSLRLG